MALPFKISVDEISLARLSDAGFLLPVFKSGLGFRVRFVVGFF
jgi:hypothetical protein